MQQNRDKSDARQRRVNPRVKKNRDMQKKANRNKRRKKAGYKRVRHQDIVDKLLGVKDEE